MKKTLLLVFVLICSFSLQAQDKKGHPFFTGTLNFTFALNENYVLFEPDDDEELLEFSALMTRFGIGYQFDEKWAGIVNIGYDHHTRFDINAIPMFGTLRYNISKDGNDSFFTQASYGNLWRPSDKYENGKYYALGIGAQIGGSGKWHAVIHLDFHRKKINHFKNGNLDSVSLGIGFSFF
ncbi:MAG: hypothetical protein ACPGU6_01255 [Tenacibaculum sp.]